MVRRVVFALLLSFAAVAAFAGADLSLESLFPTQIHYVVNQGVIFELRALNTGPDVAHNVRVTFDIPPGLAFRSAGGDAPCDLTHTPIVCSGPDIGPGLVVGIPLFGIIFTLPPQSTTLTVGATISSDTPDPRPDNNTFSQTINVEDVTNLAFVMSFTPPRVDPGATTVANTGIMNFMTSVPQDIHVHYEATDATIESIEASSPWSCTNAGTSADCTRATLDQECRCGRGLALTLRVKNDRAGGQALLKATLTTSLPDISPSALQATATVEIYRWIVVTSTADAGAGSLRDAIGQANAGCTDPCRIAFEIPPPVPRSGWFTIAPSTPLPAITADRVFVDGRTQTAFTGDTNPRGPEIEIDGRFTTSGHGLEIDSKCEAIVEGLSIGNFTDHGLAIPATDRCKSPDYADQQRIANNYLGVDPTGAAAAPNLRGLLAENGSEVTNNVISGNRASGVWIWRGPVNIHRNLIGTTADGKSPLPNGRSGIFLGPKVTWAEALDNTIAFNGEMGVAVARDAQLVDIRQNSMHDNGGLGIDIGLDGPNLPVDDDSHTQPNPPTMLSAVYDPTLNMTIVNVSVRTKFPISYGNAVQLDFYANDGPNGQGERWIGTGDNSVTSRGLALRGDFRGQWINATSSRIHWEAALPPATQSIGGTSIAGGQTATSELSNAVQVK